MWPNIYKFTKTDPLFDVYGPYGNLTPKTSNMLYTVGRYGGPALRFCMACVMGLLFTNWTYQSHFPHRKSPMEIMGGDYMEENIPGLKDTLDKYSPKDNNNPKE
jgi:hypothetical protein